MTNVQLYIAIGIPSALFALNFLGVLGAVSCQTKRFDDMKETFRSDIQRVEGTLGSELKRVEGVLGAKIDGLVVRVKALKYQMHTPLVEQS